ncbi:MAG: hypothetical protein ACJAZP_001249 [Psychromonas sp.]|jgi:hypothetical protein|uniref:hypothetical protein n=1 Tax=Psychromonas sp. TaxID=1884585 RepID=UPI0039E694AC
MVEYEFKKLYKISNNEMVTIVIDEDLLSIIVFTETNEKIGNINLDEFDNGFYIMWMYLDQLSSKYQRKGIGQACLEFFTEVYLAPIFASEDNGLVKSDGSHLTGNAPSFIAKMRRKGIVG